MILNTSGSPVLLREPETASYTQIIHDAERCLISAGNFLELSMVIEGQLGTDALAKVTGEPLLFKGEDFKKTDILSMI